MKLQLMMRPRARIFSRTQKHGEMSKSKTIPGALDFLHDKAAWIVVLMETSDDTKKYIYLDTDWLVEDGFEVIEG